MKALVKRTQGAIRALPQHPTLGKFRAMVALSPVVPNDVLPFLSPIDQIAEERPPRFMRSTLYIVLVMFVSAVTAASLVRVDTVVTARGSLGTDTPTIMLQPIDRSIIRELNVRPGQIVRKGQVLATLDPTFAQADWASLSTQQRALLAEIKRLQAELGGRPFETSAQPAAEEELQAALYRQRQEQLKSRLHYFDEEIQGLNANIQTTQDDRASLAKQLQVAREVEGMRNALLQSQNGSKLNFLEAQTVRMRTERDLQDAANRLKELQHEVEAKQAERQTFIDEWRHQLMEDLVAKRTEAAKVGEGLAKASLINKLVVVTAPADGVVLDVAKRSVGSVLNPAEPLVTIVPSSAALVANIAISSSDVGYTRAGDEVVVKVDAFPYTIHGYLKGRLLYVSEESFPTAAASGGGGFFPAAGQSTGAVHRGRVQLESTKLEHMPEGASLIPGMTLSAEIKVGSRSVISFFLYPLIRGLTESLREP